MKSEGFHVGLWGAWGAVAVFGIAGADEGGNLYQPHPRVAEIEEGIAWPEGQALPVFATPAAELDAIEVRDLSPDERITFSALQGRVNRERPRVLLLDAGADEGRDTWAETLDLEVGEMYDRSSKYELLEKYGAAFDGVVLYDPETSGHYRNLAGTVAGLKRALPVTGRVLERMRGEGLDPEIVADLTGLEFSTPVGIYGHLYEKYWPDCEKRLILSARPGRRGDLHHTRDIASAVGAAVVWLDAREDEEKELMRKFYGDMTAGDAIALGWYATERSGITTASEFGIGTLPADFYVSGSVHSGVDHRIRIPEVPSMPELENKVYVATFISDGDNIQYTQHAMRRIWDRSADSRGEAVLNWTIAPGLVDIGPGILNYYYDTASPKDCFVTGPSGMGYLMPVNTLREPGAPVGTYLEDEARMDGYARLTETYLQRSGLRVVTIWDNADPMHRASYEEHGRNLYGVTVQNFRDMPSVESSVEGGRVRFEKLVIPYTGTYDHIHGSLTERIEDWDGDEPLFLAYQMDVWHEMKPERILDLQRDVAEAHPGEVEFVRADHYFNLYNQANGLPFNLAMSPETRVRAGEASTELVTDGTPVTMWTSEEDEPWLGFDFGEAHRISRYVIRHAGEHGLAKDLNTRDFTLRASLDGRDWETVDVFTGNVENVTDLEPESFRARYLKLIIDDPGADGTARIADVEVFGSR